MAEPADRIPPAQKTYNYHKPAEEPFRAPPVQKTFNYSKPTTSGYTQRAPGAMAALAQRTLNVPPKAEAERPVLKAPKITYETTGQALSRLRGAADNYAQQNLERDRPSSDYVNMPLSEYLPKLARGVLPSALEMGIDAGEMADKAVKDPIGTGKAVLGGLGDLAVGLGSKISDSARSAMGLEVDPFASESKQRALNDLIDSAKGRYGFGEPGEFWKNLADDPASYIADAAAVTTGGLSAAKKVANIADTRQLRRIANETRQTDVAPITPPAANPPDPFYDPLPPPPNFLMDRPEGYDPFATLRPQNNREATPPAAATNLGGRTPEEFNAELDRIFGPDNRTPDQIAADLEDLRRQNEVDYGLERLGNVTDPDTEAYAALETAYDNQVPEPDWLDGPADPVFPEGHGIDPAQPNPYEDLAQPNPLDPWRHVGEDAPVRPTRTLDELDETPYYDLAFRDDAGDDIPPLTLEERRELLDYTFDDYLNRVNADPDTLPPEQYEGQNRLHLDGVLHRLRYLTGDDRYERYARDTAGTGGGVPPPMQRPQLRLRPLDATRTLDELTADTNYADMINQYSATRVNGVLNMGQEDLQSLLDSTYDEFLHRVDQPGFLNTPAGERTMSNIVTRLEALTGEDYRYYAFLGEGDPPRQRPQLRPDMNFSPAPILAPLTQSGTGIASMYSPTRRAVDQLRQSRFPDPVSMEKQLLALGAKPDELESILARIKESDVTEGGIKKLRLAELADEASNDIQQFRSPDLLYGDRHLPGGTDPHVTTFEAPVNDVPKDIQGSQHFDSKLPANSVLAHIRSIMFKTPGATKLNVYHLGEIQSDWAQFRAKLFSSNDEYLKAEDEKDTLWRHVQNLSRIGYIPNDDSLGNYAQAEAKIRKLEDRIGATDTYGFRQYFDEDFPAPYIKTTRKWHQLGLKQALIEAVNSGADYMSMSTGEQVRSYTGGKLEGQKKFYDEMTPRELDDILTKFSKEAGIEKPVIEQIQIDRGAYGVTHTVPAIRLTDEFKEAMKKYGLPSFAKGGIVTLPT